MKFNITGRNVTVSDGMKDQIDRKLGMITSDIGDIAVDRSSSVGKECRIGCCSRGGAGE